MRYEIEDRTTVARDDDRLACLDGVREFGEAILHLSQRHVLHPASLITVRAEVQTPSPRCRPAAGP
jgi:hypothetical protein